MADRREEQNDLPAPARPRFSRAEVPIGIYDGEHVIIVYELRPIPLWPKYWIRALASWFHRELDPAPKIDISVADDCIRFSIFVSPEVSVADLCKLDAAVFSAADKAGRAIEDGQAALNEKLEQVRKLRRDTR